MPAHGFAEAVDEARALLAGLRGTRPSEPELVSATSALAELVQRAADAQQSREERVRSAQFARLMADPSGQLFTTLLTDRVFRSADPVRVVDAARQLLRRLGVPSFLPRLGRAQLRALLHAGPLAPGLAARKLLERVRSESRHVVLSAEDPALSAYLDRRRSQGVRINLNHLGEAVLGEAEAERRIDGYVALLARPDVEAISVKVSAIFSQIDLLAWERTLDALTERLRVIYRAALSHLYRRPDGTQVPKLVTLDMESYRELHLTLAAFQRALAADDLAGLAAGVALQAYLPDAFPLQRELTLFAQQRLQRGGAPIRLRIVKGANLLTERVDSAARGWPLPIYASKAEVDASYKRMLEYGCHPERAAAVALGIASHNVFDLAFGMVMRALAGVEAQVGFELLEGMADPVQRAVAAIAGGTLLYAPVVAASAMQSAIAYLMRRLDENSAEENFLHHSFGMQVGDPAWTAQAQQAEQAIGRRNSLAHLPLRTQDRRRSTPRLRDAHFENEPDTDFSLAHHRTWIGEHLARERERPATTLSSVIGGEPVASDSVHDGFDPSRPGVVPYRFAAATEGDVERALEVAVRSAPGWAARPLRERNAVLSDVAAALRARRGELIAAMLLDAGKRVDQADAEVSEAIDFAEYYGESFATLVAGLPELGFAPRGVVLVTPPWNFPLAIPAGGVFAALVAGNAVVLKPALDTVLVAARLCELCWAAGVPREALQLVVCEDEVGSRLVSDARVDAVVLTGATDTARLFQRLRPGLSLCAETGGKNAIIVSASGDREEAIRDAVASAFGHAGQKCSACSLLVCEAEVYDAPDFLANLAGAAASLPVGSAWEPASVVTPLIQPPRGALLRALTTLEEGERWLLEPRRDPDNPRLWSPGIKLGVLEGSFTHTTELFGPLLGVMRADDLEHALRIANATPYGLTSGLHSLDEREQLAWEHGIRAGNLYVNRPITGAIVRRQPFGGMKASSVGPGAKAGGPGYLLQLTRVSERRAPKVDGAPHPAAARLVSAVRPHLSREQRERLSVGACSYGEAERTWFAVDHDPSPVLGERNVLRYLPVALLLRAARASDPIDVLLACTAAVTAGATFTLSLDPELAATTSAFEQLPFVTPAIEDAATAAARIADGIERVRALGGVEPEVQRACEDALVHLASAPVLLAGRIELLAYYREQTVSHRYHRYGNLSPESLLPPLRRAPRAALALRRLPSVLRTNVRG